MTVLGKIGTFPIAIHDKAIRKYLDTYTLIWKYEKCLKLNYNLFENIYETSENHSFLTFKSVNIEIVKLSHCQVACQSIYTQF